MPVITFWSNNEKAIGQTVSASLVATTMAMEHNYKILLISADFNNEEMQYCFGAQESNKEILKTLVKRPQVNLESGINGLLKLADSNRITPEIIHDYTKIVFKNRLEVIYSPMNILEDKKQDLIEKLKNIILNASKYYDYVIVDLKKGLQYQTQLDILNMSDVIVLNIDQKLKTIESFWNMEKIEQITNKVIWNICKYDEKSKYNIKNLTRNFLKKQSVYGIKYNTLIMEASQEEKLEELMIRYKTLKFEDENTVLIKGIQDLIEGIQEKVQQTRLMR